MSRKKQTKWATNHIGLLILLAYQEAGSPSPVVAAKSLSQASWAKMAFPRWWAVLWAWERMGGVAFCLFRLPARGLQPCTFWAYPGLLGLDNPSTTEGWVDGGDPSTCCRYLQGAAGGCLWAALAAGLSESSSSHWLDRSISFPPSFLRFPANMFVLCLWNDHECSDSWCLNELGMF